MIPDMIEVGTRQTGSRFHGQIPPGRICARANGSSFCFFRALRGALNFPIAI